MRGAENSSKFGQGRSWDSKATGHFDERNLCADFSSDTAVAKMRKRSGARCAMEVFCSCWRPKRSRAYVLMGCAPGRTVYELYKLYMYGHSFCEDSLMTVATEFLRQAASQVEDAPGAVWTRRGQVHHANQSCTANLSLKFASHQAVSQQT